MLQTFDEKMDVLPDGAVNHQQQMMAEIVCRQLMIKMTNRTAPAEVRIAGRKST